MEKTQRNTLINNTIMMYLLSITKLVIPLISLPYLTRVLSVECYGSVSFVKNIIAYMQIIIDFGFLISATKELVGIIKNKDEVGKTIGNTLYAQLLLAFATSLIMVILCFVLDILDGFEIFAILSLVPTILTVFLFEYVFKAYEQMGKITIRFVVMKVIALILTLIFVKSDSDIILIPIFDIIATLVAVVLVGFQLKQLGVKCKFSFKNIKEAIGMLGKSFVVFISNFMSTAFGALNVIIIGVVLTKSDVAYWTVTMQLLTAVHAMYNPIVNSVYPVMIKNKDLKLIHKILLIYTPLIVGGCLIVYFFGDWIVSLIFTEKYLMSSTLLKYIIPVLIVSFPSLLYGWPCFGAIDKEKAHYLTTVIGVIIQVLGLILLFILDSFTLINLAIVRCVSEVVLCVLRMIIVYKNKKKFFVDRITEET